MKEKTVVLGVGGLGWELDGRVSVVLGLYFTMGL
jgi:hypothetical protein